jgi:hypothetical protein
MVTEEVDGLGFFRTGGLFAERIWTVREPVAVLPSLSVTLTVAM